MQVSETLNEGLKRGYTITLPAAELEAKVNDKLKEAQPEAAMKGFRKGKVPMSLLKKQFGPRLLGEAMQESIDGAVQTQLEESGARPAMQPEVKVTNEDWKEGEDLQISVSFENLPTVPEVDFGKIKLTRLLVEADEAAVAETMGNLAKQAQNFDDRKAGAKARDGDQVVFDFVGRIDGEAFDGGAGQDHPLVLGSGSFIPGFEEQLVGVKAGDETDVKVDFPAEYGAAELAGKGAVFSCTIKAVKEPKEAEMNDELAKSFGADDLAALKADIQGRLNEEYKGAARAVAKRTLLDELDKAVEFELPVSLVDAEAGQIAHQLWHEDNPEVEGHDHGETEVTDEHKKLAVRRVKLGLLLAEVGQKAEVQVSDAELTQAVMNEARRYQGQEREFFEYVQKTPAARQQIQAPIFEDKVIDHIFALADISEEKVGKDDLQKAVEALDDGL